MQHYINSIITAVAYSSLLTYSIIGIIFFLESIIGIGAVVPAAAITIFLGFFASEGYLNIFTIFTIAVFFTSLGEILSFHLGSRGSNLFTKDKGLFKRSHLARGEEYFNNHGAKSIFFGRFIGPIKVLLPFIAGVSKMKRQKFYLLNLLSITVWLITYLSVGYFFGAAWQTIKVWTTRAEIFIITGLIFIVLIIFIEQLLIRRGKIFFAFLKSVLSSIAQGIKQNPEVVKLISRYPRTFVFLSRRLDKEKFLGLPLTLASLAFIYLLMLFSGVTEDIINSDTFIQIDLRIENLLTAFRSSTMIGFFSYLTSLARTDIIVLFTLGASYLLWQGRQKKYLIPFWLTLLGSAAFVQLGKVLVHRSRPIDAFFFESSYSFPSAHATIAVAFYGFLAYFFWRELSRWRRKLQSAFLIMIAIILIGFSRMYLGVHYLSDVWGGLLLGGMWLIIGISISEWQIRHQPRGAVPTETLTTALKIKIAGATAALLVGFLILSTVYQPRINPSRFGLEQTVITENILQSLQEANYSHYSEKLDGSYQEPMQFIIAADNDAHLREIFTRSGWIEADKATIKNVLRIGLAVATKHYYAEAPMTPSFWQAEVNAFNFQKPTAEMSVKERHHARFWHTNFQTPDGKKIYIGTASLDIGIKWWVTHRIDPAIDTEREFIFRDLETTEMIKTARKENFVQPILGSNASGDPFFTDGDIYLIELK